MARNSFTVVRLEINQKAKLKEARISRNGRNAVSQEV